MKVIVLVLISFYSLGLFADSKTDKRLDALQKKVLELEKKLSDSNRSKAGGLKVKDMNNKKIDAKRRGLSSYSEAPTISKEKQDEIMKQINAFKEKRQESQKMLDELMKDDF